VNAPLAGQVVVVTRPARQAARFLRLLEERGARAVAFPTIAVEPVPLAPDARRELEVGQLDWIVFTSANAVEHAPSSVPPGARIAAIGRATARTIEALGLRVDALPAAGADTEGLLALPAFADMTGRRVLIVKGVGGRDALRAGLAARGAQVVVAEVYRRVPAAPVAGAVEAVRRACETGRAVIAVTSVEVLESLLELAPESRVPGLLDARLVVPGERVASAARGNGWRGPIVVARSAEDEAMLAALADGAPGERDSETA
jgi:uroporphyrinogen-III synthase